MKITVDSEVRATYVEVQPGAADVYRTVSHGGVLVDFNPDGEVLGVEILDVPDYGTDVLAPRWALEMLTQGRLQQRRCGVCAGHSPSWDGHDTNPPCIGHARDVVRKALDPEYKTEHEKFHEKRRREISGS